MEEGTLKIEDEFQKTELKREYTGFQKFLCDLYMAGLIDREEVLKRLGLRNWKEIIDRMERQVIEAKVKFLKSKEESTNEKS